MRLKIKKKKKTVEDVSILTGLCQSFMSIYCILIFRVRTYNFYASDGLVNSVSGFIILFSMQTL